VVKRSNEDGIGTRLGDELLPELPSFSISLMPEFRRYLLT
jgi:hypothetical protein